MGVSRVIAKAINAEQGKVLEKIGAEVIYPERDMAVRLANRLISSKVMDYITLNENLTIMEFKLTKKLSGQTVQQAGIRNKYKLNIIAIQHAGQTITDITPELLLQENDILVVVGDKEHIEKLENVLSI
jgi:trk system potassium uptake protein TrkA